MNNNGCSDLLMRSSNDDIDVSLVTLNTHCGCYACCVAREFSSTFDADVLEGDNLVEGGPYGLRRVGRRFGVSGLRNESVPYLGQ